MARPVGYGTCAQCGRPLEAKRADARWCSDACRKAAARSLDETRCAAFWARHGAARRRGARSAARAAREAYTPDKARTPGQGALGPGTRRQCDALHRVRDQLGRDRLITIESAGSLASSSLVALKSNSRSLLVKVTTRASSPLEGFARVDRAELSSVAELTGADAVLAWARSDGDLQWIAERDSPSLEPDPAPVQALPDA